MPITNINGDTWDNIVPLSNTWTHEEIISQVMVLMNQTDNEKIQLDNYRYHLNMALSYLANLLSVNAKAYYGIYVIATLESSFHNSGLEFIDLTDNANNGTNDISTKILSLERVSVKSTGSSKRIGNCKRSDINELTGLSSNLNSQWRQSVAWCHHGNEILVYLGNDIMTTANGLTGKTYDLTSDTFVLWGQRMPVLEKVSISDISDVQVAQEGNYRNKIDIPDIYVKLLIQMMQKTILEQLGQQAPGTLDQDIANALATIDGNLDKTIRSEMDNFSKKKQGMIESKPGALI